MAGWKEEISTLPECECLSTAYIEGQALAGLGGRGALLRLGIPVAKRLAKKHRARDWYYLSLTL